MLTIAMDTGIRASLPGALAALELEANRAATG